jgi:hypothetical protein
LLHLFYFVSNLADKFAHTPQAVKTQHTATKPKTFKKRTEQANRVKKQPKMKNSGAKWLKVGNFA